MKRIYAFVLLSIAGFGAIAGCNSGDQQVAAPGTEPHSPVTAGQPPMTGQEGAGSTSAGSPPPTVMPIKDAQTAYDSAKKDYDKNSKESKVKDAYESAAMNLADAYMFGDADQKVKYRNALKYYREVMKVNPKNEKASQNADLIISIYKQMGRDVPSEGG